MKRDRIILGIVFSLILAGILQGIGEAIEATAMVAGLN